MPIVSDSLIRDPSELLSDITADVGGGFIAESGFSGSQAFATSQGAVSDNTGNFGWTAYVADGVFDVEQRSAVDVVVTDAATPNQAGVTVRTADTGGDFYALWLRPSQTNALQLFRLTSGSGYANLAGWPVPGITEARYRLELIAKESGANVLLEAYINGVLAGTYTDSSGARKLTGRPGVILRDTAIFLQNYEADNWSLAGITIDSPDNQAWASTSSRSITIEGSYSGTPASIERQVNGGTWEVAIASPVGGSFSDTFTASVGEYDIKYRFSDDTGIESSSIRQVVCPIFMDGAAQSNKSGRLTNLQTLVAGSSGTKAYLFGNDDSWKELADPYDSNAGQTDTVSSDSIAAGSWTLQFANKWLEEKDSPVAFIPNAKGGTKIESWQKDSTERSGGLNLYESMARRVALTNGVTAVFSQIGETDAGIGTLATDYKADLIQFADDVFADFGVKTIIVPLHQITLGSYNGNGTTTGQAAIRAAQIEAASESSNIEIVDPLTGIDISDGDGLHFKEDADGLEVAEIVYGSVNEILFETDVDPSVDSEYKRVYFRMPNGEISFYRKRR